MGTADTLFFWFFSALCLAGLLFIVGPFVVYVWSKVQMLGWVNALKKAKEEAENE